MKLLLTSTGIENESLVNGLKSLAGEELRFAFIPTAANICSGNKDWLIKDLKNCLNIGTVDIVDISALPKETWLSKLKKANVLVFGGGDTRYLMYWIKKSGLKEILPTLLETRTYLGISAGSIIVSEDISASSSKREFPHEKGNLDNKGLGYVKFHIKPHLNSPKYPERNNELVKELAEKLNEIVYGIDDNTGILINGNKMKIISEGNYIECEPEK